MGPARRVVVVQPWLVMPAPTTTVTIASARRCSRRSTAGARFFAAPLPTRVDRGASAIAASRSRDAFAEASLCANDVPPEGAPVMRIIYLPNAVGVKRAVLTLGLVSIAGDDRTGSGSLLFPM